MILSQLTFNNFILYILIVNKPFHLKLNKYEWININGYVDIIMNSER